MIPDVRSADEWVWLEPDAPDYFCLAPGCEDSSTATYERVGVRGEWWGGWAACDNPEHRSAVERQVREGGWNA